MKDLDAMTINALRGRLARLRQDQRWLRRDLEPARKKYMGLLKRSEDIQLKMDMIEEELRIRRE